MQRCCKVSPTNGTHFCKWHGSLSQWSVICLSSAVTDFDCSLGSISTRSCCMRGLALSSCSSTSRNSMFVCWFVLLDSHASPSWNFSFKVFCLITTPSATLSCDNLWDPSMFLLAVEDSCTGFETLPSEELQPPWATSMYSDVLWDVHPPLSSRVLWDNVLCLRPLSPFEHLRSSLPFLFSIEEFCTWFSTFTSVESWPLPSFASSMSSNGCWDISLGLLPSSLSDVSPLSSKDFRGCLIFRALSWSMSRQTHRKDATFFPASLKPLHAPLALPISRKSSRYWKISWQTSSVKICPYNIHHISKEIGMHYPMWLVNSMQYKQNFLGSLFFTGKISPKSKLQIKMQKWNNFEGFQSITLTSFLSLVPVGSQKYSRTLRAMPHNGHWHICCKTSVLGSSR